MTLSASDKLGPYEILALIGKGGMGEVYRARDPRLNRDVAIKVSAAQFSERFERETKAIAALNHPNICQIYDVGPNYLVMEYIEGESPKGPMALDEALRIARQIADALEAAHDKGITHRDLKPGNIKIKPDGTLKVLDFGLAKVTAAPSASGENSPTLTMGMTQAGMILGTASYMAPEQARGKESVDKRADIWAFGVVLYELITGKRMFTGEDVGEVLAKVIRDEPDLSGVPAQVTPLLKRCLEKDPKRRLRDIGDALPLVGDLQEAAAVPQPTALTRSHFGIIVAAFAAVVTLGFAALAFVHFSETPAPKPLIRFSVDLGPEAVVGPRITAAISPDGRRLAFVARGAGGKEQLATRLLDQTNPTFLAGTENASDPFFSPDSQWIGFFADSKMKKISVAGGAAFTLCDAPGARGASWGEDGNIVVTLSAGTGTGTGLSRVSAAGGTPQTLTKPGEGESSHRWPQILPGGQAVLFTSSTVAGAYEDGSIQVLSLKTGQWKVVQRGGYFGRYLATSNRAGQLVYVHQGALLGVPFDLDRLEVLGTPVLLLEDVAGDPATAGGQFDVSRNGTFVYGRQIVGNLAAGVA
jgi:serine/threonine-protein kinase